MSKLKSILGRLKAVVPTGRRTSGAEEPEQGSTTPVHSPDAPFMRSINLLPDEFRPDTRRIRWHPAYVAAAGLIPLVAVAIGLLYVSASDEADAAKAERDEVATRVQATQRQVEEEARKKGISALASVASAELATTVESALTARIAWDRVIDNAARVMPEGLWIRSMQGSTLAEEEEDAIMKIGKRIKENTPPKE